MNTENPRNHLENPRAGRGSESTIHRPEKLIRISALANVIAWMILGFSVIHIAVVTIQFSPDLFLGDGYRPDPDDFMVHLLVLFPSFIGFCLFAILRAISEGIFLFMDIEISLRESGRPRS